MDVAVISANLGSYDPNHPWPGYDEFKEKTPADKLDIIRLDDSNFPPRPLAMTSRLQAGIPKMFGWQLFPGFDTYIWVDASMRPEPDALDWMLEKLGRNDIVLFLHPHRRTIRQEYEFVKAKLEAKDPYLTLRYEHEWLSSQFAEIAGDEFYHDNRLYASTVFAYRNVAKVHRALRDWWYHKTRYLLHDQLALPYVVKKNGLAIGEIRESIYRCEHFTYVRNKK